MSDRTALAPSQRMRVAYILTLVGGYLDAYTYFERGGVFANAQTGNIVKLGIALANGTRELYLFYLIPIMSFAVGIFVALAIEERLTQRGLRLVRRSVLAVEMCVLVAVGLIPLGEEGDLLANSMVAFVSALQFETFNTFHGEAINTMMSTGNLRKCVDHLFVGIVRNDRSHLRSAGIFASVICDFTLGAIIGTRACDMLGRAAVLPAVCALGLAILIITMLRKRNSAAA